MALTVKIRADASHFKKTIAGVEVQASGLSGVIGKLATSNLAFGAALSVAAAGAVALGAGLAFIKDASGKAAGMESLQVQFEVLTKSASKATELIKSFRDEAVKSPLSVQDYAQAGKTLMAFGIAADETLPILKTLGDVSMGNAERFGSLALAFAQTQAAGRLMGQEVLQFVNAGFNPLQEISRKTGRSMIELKKAMEDGAISADMVTEAFRSATAQGGLFYGALDKGATTTEGKIAKFGDAIMGLKVAFGTGFNDGLKAALDATNSFLPQLEAKFAQFGQMLGTAIKQAVDGDYQMLSAVGEVIGEAIMAGMRTTIKVGATSLLRDGIGGYVGLGGHLINDPSIKGAGKAINAMIGSAMGPRPGMAETLQGELQSGGMSSALGRVQSANLTPTWAEELERNRKLTEELVSQGKTSITELKKAFGGKSQVMFSR
jgi:tape measure domain-containing protein